MPRVLPNCLLAAAILLGCGPTEKMIDVAGGEGGNAGAPRGGSGGSTLSTGGVAGQTATGGVGGTGAGRGGVPGNAGGTTGTVAGGNGAAGAQGSGNAPGTAGTSGTAGTGGTGGGGGASMAGGVGGSNTGGVGAVEAARAKFHLYLMIGQSNMEGTGPIFEEDMVAPSKVFKFTKDMQWIAGNEPTGIGRMGRTVGGAGVSMGRTFAIEMMTSQTDPDVKIGLINLAVSGSLIQSWLDPPPVRTTDPTRPFDMNYAKMLPYLREALKSGSLKGVLWHLGEANGSPDIPLYLPQVIQLLRNEVKDPSLPVVLGEVGITTLTDNKNKALAKVAAEVPRVGLATCENLQFKEGLAGLYDTPSYREYGRRYAVVMKKLIAAGQ